MTEKEELLNQIRSEIASIKERMKIGVEIIGDCKRQLKILSGKLKEYERLEEKIFSSASDGDL